MVFIKLTLIVKGTNLQDNISCGSSTLWCIPVWFEWTANHFELQEPCSEKYCNKVVVSKPLAALLN